MDAKPVRRALHPQTDENMVPPQKQSLHQRHKSTGALMLGAGGLKGGAKRAVFGDVSNTARVLNNAHDDLSTLGKNNGSENIKPSLPEKVNVLNRPAQRPLSTVVKNFLGHNSSNQSASTIISNNKTSQSVTVQPLPSSNPSQSTRPRALSKRATAIYKDENVAESEEISQPGPLQSVPINSIPLPPVGSTLLGPRQHRSQPQLKVDQPILRRTQSRYIANPVSVSAKDIVPTSVVQKTEVEQTQEKAIQHETELQECAYLPQEAPAQLEHNSGPVETNLIIQRSESFEHEERELPPLPLVSEAEEYWEEEEEEVYDEQGYTTAHSYRSRGDNTTGGATTVMIPKVSSNVERELAAAKMIVEGSRTREDIEDDAWDTSMVAEYGEEIFGYMRELESKLSPNPHYMDGQAEIQWSMRSVLMDWLVQVHHRFSLLPETLFLCVNYIDRFLSVKVVSLGKLQLVGATAIFIAAKYEEINCPSVSEIVYMVDDGYSADEILKAERFMLGMLNFELGWPGPMSFLRRISKADDYDLETRTLAKYFLEVTIMDERFVGSPPSFVAAGAHCISRMMLKKGDWSPAHVHYSGYTWTQLRPLAALMLECCTNAEKHHGAIFDKYSDRRYKRASQFVKTTIEGNFKLPPSNPAFALHSPIPIGCSDGYVPYDTYESRDSYNNLVPVKG